MRRLASMPLALAAFASLALASCGNLGGPGPAGSCQTDYHCLPGCACVGTACDCSKADGSPPPDADAPDSD